MFARRHAPHKKWSHLPSYMMWRGNKLSEAEPIRLDTCQRFRMTNYINFYGPTRGVKIRHPLECRPGKSIPSVSKGVCLRIGHGILSETHFKLEKLLPPFMWVLSVVRNRKSFRWGRKVFGHMSFPYWVYLCPGVNEKLNYCQDGSLQ